MKLPLLIVLFIVVHCHSIAQKTDLILRNPDDNTQNKYYKVIPHGEIKGLLVLNGIKIADSSINLAYQKGIFVMMALPMRTSAYLENNLTNDSCLDILDAMIGEVIKAYKIPANKIIIGGMSATGTSAVKYVQYCVAGRSKNKINPAGLFGIDPPLDYERMWYEQNRALELKYNEDAVKEARDMLNLLNDKMHGTPFTNINAYRNASPYCHSAKQGGNAVLLNNVYVRFYTQPDINWWIDNRRKDYYDMNALDIAGLIDQLKINGNKHAYLIVTNVKTEYPHSLAIMDQYDMIKWCEDVLDSK